MNEIEEGVRRRSGEVRGGPGRSGEVRGCLTSYTLCLERTTAHTWKRRIFGLRHGRHPRRDLVAIAGGGFKIGEHHEVVPVTPVVIIMIHRATMMSVTFFY